MFLAFDVLECPRHRTTTLLRRRRWQAGSVRAVLGRHADVGGRGSVSSRRTFGSPRDICASVPLARPEVTRANARGDHSNAWLANARTAPLTCDFCHLTSDS